MEFTQLRYFVAVAHGESMRKTAESLHVAQTTLSMSIKKLEDDLGVKLFDRYSNSFKLTPAGTVFLQKASKLLLEAEAMRQEALSLGHQGRDIINIGVGATGLTIEACLVFSALKPEVSFNFMHDWSRPASSFLLSQQAEICTSFFPVENLGVVSVLMLNEPVFAMVSKKNPLARRLTLTVKEMAEHAVLTTWPGTDTRRLVEHLFTSAGVVPRELVEAGDLETHFHYVRHDLGVGFVSETTANMMLSGREFSAEHIAIIPLEDSFCRRNTYLSYLRDRTLTPVLAEFYKFFETFCRMAQERKMLPDKEDFANVDYMK